MVPVGMAVLGLFLATGPAWIGLGLLDPYAAAPEPSVSRRAVKGEDQPRSTPELPRAEVDVTEPRVTGRTIHVAAGGRLQDALDAARPGDRITLEAGGTFEGPFRLPKKDGDGWIVIASSGLNRLPADTRVSPSNAGDMPKLVASSRAVIVADPGAHHYRFAGVEITPSRDSFIHNLVELGADESSLNRVPHHVVFDRSYIHGDPRKGGRRGIALNGREVAVIHSHLSDFKEVGADSQAIAGWNGPGPIRIENNYLEAAGENIMFGGADPAIQGLVPSDIVVRRNHLAKPLRWKIDHPTYEGTPWAVKNLFELKNARRVLVEWNLLEHNWPHAQNGFAILFTVRNQDGAAPWSVVEDVTFQNNAVRRVAAGVNVLGRDDNHKSRQTARISIQNNLFTEVGGEWGGNGRLFQLLSGTSDVSIRHNTAAQSGGAVFGGDDEPHSGFVFQNNVMPDNGAGFVGSGTAPGVASLVRFFPDAVVTGNAFIGGAPAHYPPGNSFPRSESELKKIQGTPPGADLRSLQDTMDKVIWKR
jgi:hypothetical protein